MVLAIETVGSGIWARPLARPSWARDRQMISVKAIWRKHSTFAETGRGRDPSLKRKTAMEERYNGIPMSASECLGPAVPTVQIPELQEIINSPFRP